MACSSMRLGSVRALIALGVAAALGGVVDEARGQCVERWQPFDSTTAGFAGTNGTVYAMTPWDPDGPGPANAVWLFAGSFTAAGNAVANKLAAFDPESHRWSSLGGGLNGSVWDVKQMTDGRLIAVGSFTAATNPDGVSASVNRVARWTGESWVQAGTVLQNSPSVYAVSESESGDPIIGGRFGFTNGGPYNVARLAGSTWASFGGLAPLEVYEFESTPDGPLYSGGRTGGGDPFVRIAKLTGDSWTVIGSGSESDGVDSHILDMTVLDDGSLIAVGFFNYMNGVTSRFASRWDGTSWNSMSFSRPLVSNVSAVTTMPDGRILAAYTVIGVETTQSLIRWTGTEWVDDGDAYLGRIEEMMPIGEEQLLACGSLAASGGRSLGGIAVRESGEWRPLFETTSQDFPFELRAMLRMSDGDVVVVGAPQSISLAETRLVWRWNGEQWSAMGSNPIGKVYAAAEMANGDLVVAGTRAAIVREPIRGVARWNGSSWTALGGTLDFPIWSLLALPNGDLVIGGSFTFTTETGAQARNIARWNGQRWESVGHGVNGTVYALERTADGHIVVGGEFTEAGGYPHSRIAIWDGSAWVGMGAGVVGSVRSIAALANGSVVVGGQLTAAGGQSVVGAARWASGTWWPMPGFANGATVHSLTERSTGELVAAGNFGLVESPNAKMLARWNGGSWTTMGVTSVVTPATSPVAYFALEVDSRGLVTGGNFDAINGVVSRRIARFDDAPFVRDHPVSTSVVIGDDLVLRARPGAGFAGVSVQWTRDGVGLIDGTGGASSGGGVVTGASGAMASPTDESDAVLRISNAQAGDSGEYRAVFSSACGATESRVASVLVAPVEIACAPCAADYDQDGGVGAGDVAAFVADFEAGGICADVNGDGGVDGGDVGAFFEVYLVGGC